MVTPRREVLRVPSGASAHFGRTAAWHERAVSGAWYELPNSVFSAAGVGWPDGKTSITTAFSTNFDYQAVIRAWGGGVLNTVGVNHAGVFVPGAHLVLWGGGHGDYAGNELYAYGPLQSAAPVWRRLNDPTIPPANDTRRTAAGAPVSRHTYDTLVYLPSVNKMVAFGAPGAFATGSDMGGAELFDFAANTWEEQDEGFGIWPGNGTINAFTSYDPLTRRAWCWGNGNGTRLASYSADTGVWTCIQRDNPNAGSNQKGAIAPELGLFVHVNSTAQVSVLNLNEPASPRYLVATMGTPPSERDGLQTPEWHEGHGAFMFFDGDGSVFFLTPGENPAAGGDPWIWTSRPPAGAAVPSLRGNEVWGTFGRWRRVPASGLLPAGMLLMRHPSSPILYLKD